MKYVIGRTSRRPSKKKSYVLINEVRFVVATRGRVWPRVTLGAQQAW